MLMMYVFAMGIVGLLMYVCRMHNMLKRSTALAGSLTVLQVLNTLTIIGGFGAVGRLPSPSRPSRPF
jgi:hypothetical protein